MEMSLSEYTDLSLLACVPHLLNSWMLLPLSQSGLYLVRSSTFAGS
jgi:hypothetical protein